MTRAEFEGAPLKEKVYKVLEAGKPLADRQFLYFQIRLYALSDFYAEIWYVPSTNQIDRVETLTLDEVLRSYDGMFNISDLLN